VASKTPIQQRLKNKARIAAEKAFVSAVSHPVTSRGMAYLVDLKVPSAALTRVIKTYSRVYDVDMSEVADPIASFGTFNDFFTRALKDGSRPVDQDPRRVASPADARLSVFGPVPKDGQITQVKGITYPIDALLGDETEAAPFAHGYHATLYLSPRDYHRVHFPVDGTVTGWRHIPGRLFPVNDLALQRVPNLFCRNERVVVHMDTEEFGRVATVMVGAAHVGRISLAFTDLVSNRGHHHGDVTADTPVAVRKGDELGRFNLGSTVVMLFERGDLIPADVLEGQQIRMGQALASLPKD
jgi:phosphatidylserine decarboxylase